MPYPQLAINLRKLQHNARMEVETLSNIGIEVMGVNKVFNGLYETAEAMFKGGINVIAEANVNNLMKLKDLPCKKALLRTPALSQIEDVVKYADMSLNSEIKIVEALSQEAVKQNKIHEILLMLDLGDLREGIWFENKADVENFLEGVLALPNIIIYGVGTNFNCYGTVVPTVENISTFISIAEELEKKFNITFKYLSGGNGTSYHLVDKGLMPERINHLRIGSLHEFGIDYVTGTYVNGYYHSSMAVNKYASDLYVLKAEIIELNSKPTVPVGELGFDAFMNQKTFIDRGTRKRAILAFGRQDVPYENIHPVDPSIELLGQTSDHTIIDIEDCKTNCKLGDIISFELDYTALLLACNSPGIHKSFVND